MPTGPSMRSLMQRFIRVDRNILRIPTASLSINVQEQVTTLIQKLTQSPQFKFESPCFADNSPVARNRLRIMLLACHILQHRGFGRLITDHHQLELLFVAGLDSLAKHIPAQNFLKDEDRAEELIRHCLDYLGITPRGENEEKFEKRFNEISSVRKEILHESNSMQRSRHLSILSILAKQSVEMEVPPKIGRE